MAYRNRGAARRGRSSARYGRKSSRRSKSRRAGSSRRGGVGRTVRIELAVAQPSLSPASVDQAIGLTEGAPPKRRRF